MKLFNYENYQVVISEEAYNIKAFRDLVKRDRSKNKYLSSLELGFVYFFADPRSDYAYIVDETERADLIKVQEGLPENWSPDDKILHAVQVYRDLTQTTSSMLLADTRLAIENVRAFLKQIDLNALDDKGKPIYTVNTIVSAIKQIPELIAGLTKVEETINKELQDSGRMKANRVKKVAEDGIENFIK